MKLTFVRSSQQPDTLGKRFTGKLLLDGKLIWAYVGRTPGQVYTALGTALRLGIDIREDGKNRRV